MTTFTQQIDGILQDENCQIVNEGENPFYLDDVDEDVEPFENWEEDADEYSSPDTFDESIGARVN